MSERVSGFSLRALLSGDDRGSVIILLLAPIILTTFKYYGTKAFYLSSLAGRFAWLQNSSHAAELYHFLAAFVLLGLVPALIVRLVFREPLSAYGLQVGDFRFGVKALLVLAPISVAVTYPNARGAEFLAEYPFDEGAGASPWTFLSHAATYLLYYAGWEFFFRGFMLFGLRSRCGDANAILIQTLASCLVHIGKPTGEIYGSILAGALWGTIVLRTRSLWAALIIHWLLGVSLDFFICYR